jgi:predicted MFS family arabinose efflux permease
MLLWADDFRSVFWIAVIPGVLSVCVLAWGVKEPERNQAEQRGNPVKKESLRSLGSAYWWVVAVGAVFTLARFSEAFLILRAQQLGVPMALVPLVMVAMSLVYATSAYPLGELSDRMNHTEAARMGIGDADHR